MNDIKFRTLREDEIEVRIQSVTEKGCIEKWKDIKGYEGLYQVSNIGRVRSLGNRSNHKGIKYLTPKEERYKRVKLYKNSKGKMFMVHRLVAEAFIPNHFNKKEVNHIDGNKYNNKVVNLEWVTREENHIHKCVNGLNSTKEAVESNKINIIQIDTNGKIINYFESMSEAARKLDLSVANICNVCKGKLKNTKGYIFKYKEVD